MAKLYEFIKIKDYEWIHFNTCNWNRKHIDQFYKRFCNILNGENNAVNKDQFAYFLDRFYEVGYDLSMFLDDSKYPNGYYIAERIIKEGGGNYKFGYFEEFKSAFPYGIVMIESGGFVVTIFGLSREEFNSRYNSKRPLDEKEWETATKELKDSGTVGTPINAKKANHKRGLFMTYPNSFTIVPTSGLVSTETVFKLNKIDLREVTKLRTVISQHVEKQKQIYEMFRKANMNALYGYDKIFIKMIDEYFKTGDVETKFPNKESEEIFVETFKELGINQPDLKFFLDFAFKHFEETKLLSNLEIPQKDINALYQICTKE